MSTGCADTFRRAATPMTIHRHPPEQNVKIAISLGTVSRNRPATAYWRMPEPSQPLQFLDSVASRARVDCFSVSKFQLQSAECGAFAPIANTS